MCDWVLIGLGTAQLVFVIGLLWRVSALLRAIRALDLAIIGMDGDDD